MFATGSQVGAYTILRQIGAGGMGEVYEARHRHLDRRAAIKFLLPGYSSSEAVINRFFNEAKAASVIHHPGIVEILDCDVHQPTGRAYIVMELLAGEDLGTCLRRVGGFGGAVRAGAAISGQIAVALSAAHAKGITHRDLKPDNVFLARDANGSVGTTVKVLDFGVAKLVAEGKGGVGATRPGSLLGTPLYMAPEQCRSADRVDHRSDIYSLGCMMFELFSGRTPFVGEGEGDLLLAHISEQAPDLQSLVPGLDSRLATLVQSMLAKDPAARPQTMSEIVGALERLLGTDVKSFGSLIEIPTGFTRRADVASASPSAPGSGSVGDPARKAPSGPVARTMLLPNASTTLSQSAAEVEGPAMLTAKPRGRGVAAIVAGVVAIGGVVVFVAVGRSSSSTGNAEIARTKETSPATELNPQPTAPAPSPTPAAPSPAPVEQPVAPRTVTVRVSSVPNGAEVFVGGEAEARGTTPLAISMRAGTPATSVTLKAANYAPKLVVIDGSRDTEISAELQTQKKKEGQAGHHKHDSESHGAPAYKAVGD